VAIFSPATRRDFLGPARAADGNDFEKEAWGTRGGINLQAQQI
jgi:hypothetical protein